MLFDIQRVERTREGIPSLRTDLVSSSKRRIYNRVKELNARRQQCRVVNQQGRVLDGREIEEMR